MFDLYRIVRKRSNSDRKYHRFNFRGVGRSPTRKYEALPRPHGIMAAMTDPDEKDPAGAGTPGRRKRGRRGPRKATAASLENAALHYLGRYATSSWNLRRVLMGKVERSARFHGTDRDVGAAVVDALVARYEERGLLDDRAYAEARAAGLHRRGASARAIRARLVQKGVERDLIDAALGSLASGPGEPELAAALACARRRRLGPYRPAAARKAKREKDLASLARAGFAYDIARRVVEAETAEELERELVP